MFGGISRHFFRHVSISKSDEPRGELSLLKLSQGEDATSALAKVRFLSQFPHLCHTGDSRCHFDKRLIGRRRWWYGHRESMWRDMWRELRRWSRQDRWRDIRGRDDGSGRSLRWSPSSCLPMRYRQWGAMSRRERLPTRCANHLRGIPGWRLSWWMKWCRREMRTRCPAFHNLRGRKVLIYRELKFWNIYKWGGGKTDDADLAAGLRLVAKVSFVYIWLAFIIVIYVL